MKFQTVRGMRDFSPEQAAKKQWIEDTLRQQFELFGFQPLQTPVVEEFGLLSAKGSGGEAIRDEIYYFKDKGERELGLRFDLTVPLGRFVAANPQLPKPFKRYQIGTVYRYDRPGAKRYREFTQADWDIVGSSGPESDFEAIALAISAMKALGFKEEEFFVKVNTRPLLEEAALCCGIGKDNVMECFRCLDKIDKQGEEAVRREMREKGIDTRIVGQIKERNFEKIKVKDSAPLLELKGLMQLLKESDLEKFVRFDLSLARGLEYYTGVVFEVCVEGSPSVGGGGRYDRLIETYGGPGTPAVGGSFGVDRLLDTLESRIEAEAKTRVFVFAIGEKMRGEALSLAQKIRALGINCAADLNARSAGKNLEYADKRGIPFAAIIGENELKAKEFTLKEMKSGKETKVKLANLKELLPLLNKAPGGS